MTLRDARIEFMALISTLRSSEEPRTTSDVSVARCIPSATWISCIREGLDEKKPTWKTPLDHLS